MCPGSAWAWSSVPSDLLLAGDVPRQEDDRQTARYDNHRQAVDQPSPRFASLLDAGAGEQVGDGDRADGGEEPVDVDHRAPPHRAVLDDVRAGRPGAHPEAAALAFLAAVVVPASTTAAARHGGRGDDGDA